MKITTGKEVSMDFERWLDTSAAGETLVYHVGESLNDSEAPSEHSLWTLRDAYNSGFVTFTQRRLSWGVGANNKGSQFEYRVVRRRAVEPPSVALSKDTGQTVHLFRSRFAEQRAA